MPQVQVNKYIRLALTVLTGLLGLLAAYNWGDIVDQKTAGILVVAFSGVKAIIDAIAPGSGVQTAPTGDTVITHKAVGST